MKPRRFTLTNSRSGSPIAFTNQPRAAHRWVADGGCAFDTVEHRWVTA